ncbi:MAG: tandem-95 repeat protein [Caldilineaceae bacterium]|nr:tandem-95 repeat protein [Caldilineaceae bacterium]
MQRRIFASLLAILLVMTTVAVSLAAPPPLPSSFYGTATLNGANVPDGTRISVWIGGVKVAEAPSRTVDGVSSYVIDVPGVDSSTEGATISFQVDGYAADQSGIWHSGAVTALDLTATPPPVAPVANNASVTTAEDTAVAIVLSAFDANNDTLTYTIVAAPTHGALSGTAPNLLYTPHLDYNGTDSFTFKVSDGSQDSNIATVSITITPVPDEPTAQNGSIVTDEDMGVVITLQASDPNGDPLTFTVLTNPAHGSLNGAPPGLIYDPAPNFNGTDSFTFKVNDGRFDSNVATVSITVRSIPDAPQIAGVANPSMDEGQILNITIPASDPDGTVPTLSAANLPSFASFSQSNGTATLRFAPDFTQAGTYPNITVTASDGSLSASTTFTLTVNDVAPMPRASFSTGKELNAAQWEDGAGIAAFSSVFSTSSSHRAENAIDNNASSAWHTANGQPNNGWIKVALAGNTLHVIDRVVIRSNTSTATLKDFQIRVSTTGVADGDFTTVFAGSVPRENNSFTYTFAPVQARYVQLVAVNNWGFGSYTQVFGFEARNRNRDGGIVSLIDGPRPTLESFTSQYDNGHRAELALDDDAVSRWASGNGQRTNQSLVVQLAGGKSYAIDRVRVQPRFDCCFDQRVKDFEIWVSADNINYTQVLAATAADNGTLQEFVFPGGATHARYVKYVALNNRGSTCCISTATFQVITLDGHNVARLGGVGGSIASFSSVWDPQAQYQPGEAIDFDANTDWDSGNGQNSNQWISVRLIPGAPYLVDRVRIRGFGGSASPKDFLIQVSTTGIADADFTTVFSGQLPNDGGYHWYNFAPVAARFVRFYILNNYGHINIRVYDFQVYSTQVGGESVPFDDHSTNPFGPIVAWDWDFGDGNSSSERHPIHTFNAPGTYSVTLTVTNSDGVTDTVIQPYTVLQRPAGDFAWTPATPNEGQNVSLADTSTDADGSVIGWLWKFHYTTSQPTTQNTTANFPDNGDHPVVLTVTDSQLLTTVVTKTISVNNVPPTVDIGPDAVIRRTGERLRIPGDETFRNWNDASSVDRAAMQFLWDTGDGRTFTSQTVDYSYATPGVYTVRLTLTDPQGATATDTLQVTVYDDAVAPTTSVLITGSRNVALPQTLNLPSLLSLGASVHSFSSQYDNNHRVENLLDFNTGSTPWATQSGKTTNQWAIIRLAGDGPHTMDRIQIQPRGDCCPDQRVKDFEVWVSATDANDASFTRVLSATAADNGNLQEFILPGGPVAARFVKYVALNARGANACCISTSSFHVVSVDALGVGGAVAASSQFDATSAPALLLDDNPDSIWRTANGQSSGWVKILLADGQTWPIHGVSLVTPNHGEAVRDFEIWVSTTTDDDAAFTRIFTGTMSTTSAQQDFFFPEVNARYVKVIALNNRGSSCCVRLGTLQVRASVPAEADGWYDTDVLATLIAVDNPGGSGVAKIETSTNGTNWSTYTGPFLFGTAGSNPIWGRATDVARNLGAPDQRYAAIDKTPKLDRYEAGQAGIDWLSTAAWNKTGSVLKCVACHVAGDSLHGLAVSTSTGYQVDTSANSDLVALVNFMTDPAYQRDTDGLWPYEKVGQGNSFLTMNSSHSLFGMAMYDRYISTNKTDNLIRGVEGMLPRQQSNGRWATDHTMAPTNQGDILPTTHMIFALQQAKTRVDAATAARYQTALDKAVTWLRSAALSIYSQDKSMKLLGLLEGGMSRNDADVVALRTQILADQLADGGWRENSSKAWSSVFSTGQSLYALCRAGVSRFDPQVVKGIDWLRHTQTRHNSDTLVQRYLQDGPWLLQYTDAAAPFVSTMWAVIALGCFGELGLDFSVTPAAQTISPDVAAAQIVTFNLTLVNTGAEDDTYDLAISGGLPGWDAAVSANLVSLAVGENTTVDLVITAPANQPQNLVTLYSITATSRKNRAVTRAASVSVSTSALPTGGRPTLTQITAGNGASSPVDYPVRLAATVTDTVGNLRVTGPDSGVVNFLVAGIAVGSDADSDGDGVYEILWTPGATWTRLGSQDLRAIYSGVDRPDPQPDLQSSFASGNLTLTGAVRPVAESQTLTTDKNTPLSITLTAVDPNGDTLTFSVATTPAHGALSGSAPALIYTPDPGFVGDDSFTFTASDGSNVSLPATVSISVVSTNEPPTLDDVDDTMIDEGATLTVTATAGDPDGDALTLTAGSLPSFASFTDNGDGTGSFNFTPGYDDAGIYASITLTVSDGELSDSDTFLLTVNNVNRGPVANHDSATTDEETPVTVDLLANDSDPDGDALSLSALGTPVYGTVAVSDLLSAAVYTPALDFHGTDTFTYTVSDGSLNATATVTVTVNAVNDAPTLDDVDDEMMDEGATLTVTVTAGDPDGDALTLTAGNLPSFASFIDNGDGTGSISFAPGYVDSGVYDNIGVTVSDGELSASNSFTLTVNNVNRAPVAVDQTLITDEDSSLPITLTATDADGDALTFSVVNTPTHGTLSGSAPDLTYTPAPNYHGEESFTFMASDGSIDSNIATVSITINPVNDAPTLQTPRSALEVNEGETATVDGIFDDMDGDAITLTASVGNVIGNADGSWTWSFVTSDGPGESQPITISADDGNGGSAEVSFGLTVLNLNPIAVDDSASVNEKTAVAIAVLANDSDVPADTLTITALGMPSHGTAAVSGQPSAVIYTPTLNFSGSDVFTYTVSDKDGGSATATVTVTVNAINDAPTLDDVDDVMMDEGATLTVMIIATDRDGDALTLIVGNLPGFASFVDNGDGTGTLSFAPGYDHAGVYAEITVTASDGHLIDTDSFTLTVNNVNHAPVAADDNAITDEDAPVIIAVLTNDSDPDGGSLSLTALSAPTYGLAAVSGPSSAVIYTPTLNFHGADTFTYTISDGALSVTATVRVTVNPVNDAPIAMDDEVEIGLGQPVTITVLANDYDVEDSALRIVSIRQPVTGTATLRADGRVTYTPTAGFKGTDHFTYTISDGEFSATATVIVRVVMPPVVYCELYPIALHTAVVAGATPGAILADIFNGSGSGNFGWLSWTGNPNVPTLINNLTPPGGSDTYINPNNSADNVVSVGDWVRGSPGVSNAKGARDALDRLKTMDIVVPVWDSASGGGNNAQYRVASFATVRILDYSLPGQNRIKVRYLGSVACGAAQNRSDAESEAWEATPTEEPLPVAENLLYMPLLQRSEPLQVEVDQPQPAAAQPSQWLYLPAVMMETQLPTPSAR